MEWSNQEIDTFIECRGPLRRRDSASKCHEAHDGDAAGADATATTDGAPGADTTAIADGPADADATVAAHGAPGADAAPTPGGGDRVPEADVMNRG